MIATLLKQLRIHQWFKNLLVFLPIIFAHRISDTETLIATAVAAICFCMVASAVYTMNDLADASSDAFHPIKRNRPIASGKLPKRSAVLLCSVLATTGFALALAFTHREFLYWLVCYAALNVLYSFWLRRMVLVDVVVLSGFYTIRVIAGAAAASVPTSTWLLAFSTFTFISLAFLKRYTELRETDDRVGAVVSDRGYTAGDAALLLVLGPAMGCIAVLVFVLYVTSPSVSVLYLHPDRLWMLTPVMIYWIARMWLLANRGVMHEDAIVFVRKDLPSFMVLLLTVGIVVWAL